MIPTLFPPCPHPSTPIRTSLREGALLGWLDAVAMRGGGGVGGVEPHWYLNLAAAAAVTGP